jgi:hypothetical protein
MTNEATDPQGEKEPTPTPRRGFRFSDLAEPLPDTWYYGGFAVMDMPPIWVRVQSLIE